MTYRIIMSPHWEGCDALSDTRVNLIYGYEELDGARYVTDGHDDEGEICFMLADGRIAWLVSTDIEQVDPYDDPMLRYEVQP